MDEASFDYIDSLFRVTSESPSLKFVFPIGIALCALCSIIVAADVWFLHRRPFWIYKKEPGEFLRFNTAVVCMLSQITTTIAAIPILHLVQPELSLGGNLKNITLVEYLMFFPIQIMILIINYGSLISISSSSSIWFHRFGRILFSLNLVAWLSTLGLIIVVNEELNKASNMSKSLLNSSAAATLLSYQELQNQADLGLKLMKALAITSLVEFYSATLLTIGAFSLRVVILIAPNLIFPHFAPWLVPSYFAGALVIANIAGILIRREQVEIPNLKNLVLKGGACSDDDIGSDYLNVYSKADEM